MCREQWFALSLVLFCVGVSVCQDDVISVSCPRECVCYRQLTTVKCQESLLNDLPHIARALATQVQVLDMSRSQIQKLKSNSLAQYPRLKRLILRGNNISDIDVNALENVPELEDLDLRENVLKTLPNKVFHNTKLKVLYLASNPFSCEPSMLPALTSAIKGFMRDNGDIEEFDGGLLKCAEPLYMENVKLINIIDADKSSFINHANNSTSIKLWMGIIAGVVVLTITIIATVFVIMKRKKSKEKYHYDFLNTSTGDEDSDQSNNEKTKENFADILRKKRRQSQGYPSQDIIGSDEEETFDQESYIKEKLKSQRRHSMGYASENDSDEMEEINLENP